MSFPFRHPAVSALSVVCHPVVDSHSFLLSLSDSLVDSRSSPLQQLACFCSVGLLRMNTHLGNFEAALHALDKIDFFNPRVSPRKRCKKMREMQRRKERRQKLL